jgi:hypothetical protein
MYQSSEKKFLKMKEVSFLLWKCFICSYEKPCKLTWIHDEVVVSLKYSKSNHLAFPLSKFPLSKATVDIYSFMQNLSFNSNSVSYL